ncbi:MAG: nickel pincer cofactor biosynthesis protein LarB [Rhodospirillaceae bacterium]|nr:nickel pincer cofactor biosynthesis protein LarB [Rhodospirillaceae bacterium]
MTDLRFDWARRDRTGVAEAVLAEGKSGAQIRQAIVGAQTRQSSLLLTRLAAAPGEELAAEIGTAFDYDAVSRTAILDHGLLPTTPCDALIVTGGSSDLPVAREAQRTLRFHGLDVGLLADCGVAGLWRLTDHADRLRAAPAIIAVAGMEGALFPVVAGLTPALVIAVPSSVGYGVAVGGRAALSTALATCAPGVVTVNIDNGFGAACALIKILRPGAAPAHAS